MDFLLRLLEKCTNENRSKRKKSHGWQKVKKSEERNSKKLKIFDKKSKLDRSINEHALLLCNLVFVLSK